MEKPILVTGAIIEKNGSVLIAQRKSGYFAGKWEFAGGKVEYGESPEECLIREIQEELNVTIAINELVTVSSYIYPNKKHYVLIFYRCHILSGKINMLDHQDLKWEKKNQLSEYDFLEADLPAVKKCM